MSAISNVLLCPKNPRGCPPLFAASPVKTKRKNDTHKQLNQRGIVDHHRGTKAKRQHGKIVIASR